MKVLIKVIGCDDTTRVTVDVTEEEKAFLERIADLVTDASEYSCMPTMEVFVAQENPQ